ncbi:MAG: nitroreductase family protein [Candidatus Pacebacteria bacterium]|nr:nitroreductase family protein [Candidatus Paceibacterota bacterium]
MNQTLDLFFNHRSVRVYEKTDIPEHIKEKIFQSMLRGPTAGNGILYSVIEVKDQEVKEILAKSCDNQPFIAKAPLVLLVSADYQRWYDYFMMFNVEQFCEKEEIPMEKPKEGDLVIALCDAIIAAQTAAIAAESFGIGSCFIGDILEKCEIHRKLFNLPQYVFPICLLCLGYPTEQQKNRELTSRFDEKFIFSKNKYERLNEEDLKEMFEDRQKQAFGDKEEIQGCKNYAELTYKQRFGADFMKERRRSVKKMIEIWNN